MNDEIWLFSIVPVKRKIRINGKVKIVETDVVIESDEWKTFKKEYDERKKNDGINKQTK